MSAESRRCAREARIGERGSSGGLNSDHYSAAMCTRGTSPPRRRQQRRLVGRCVPGEHTTPGTSGIGGGLEWAPMPTHVALLRGINVGGRNRLAMADLRATGTPSPSCSRCSTARFAALAAAASPHVHRNAPIMADCVRRRVLATATGPHRAFVALTSPNPDRSERGSAPVEPPGPHNRTTAADCGRHRGRAAHNRRPPADCNAHGGRHRTDAPDPMTYRCGIYRIMMLL